MRKNLLILLIPTLLCTGAFAQDEAQQSEAAIFRFVPGDDMFYSPWGGNDAELSRLYTLVDEYHAEITSGHVPLHVEGYCASGENAEAGLRIAAIRSNRVKSELIVNKKLAEGHFITKNHATTYSDPDGKTYGDVVVVTMFIPVKTVLPGVESGTETQPEPVPLPESQPKPVSEPQPEPKPDAMPSTGVETPALPRHPGKASYRFAVRTNLLYDAFLLPTLGVEWRTNQSIGIKVDGSYSFWGDEHGKVQKIWLVNPEVRYYMGNAKRFYVGVSANFGELNIYGGIPGTFLPNTTGYQGDIWNAGITTGYQLRLSRAFSLDFNLGFGYSRFHYDSFSIEDQTRVYKAKAQTKSFWGPTQVGINFVWKL